MAAVTTTYYTLNNCCTNQPINWPPNEEGLQGTLYLEFDGTSCNEGEFNNIPCPNDLTNLIITEILNEFAGGVFTTGCLKLTSVSITEIPVGADILDWDNTMSEVSTVPTCEDCQTCNCYTLYSCGEGPLPINTKNQDFEDFVGQFVSIKDYPGCWYVTLNESGVCENPVNVELFSEVPCDCIAKCYLTTGNPSEVQYVNIEGELITTTGNLKICSLTYPIVSGGSPLGMIYQIGECDNGSCDDICYTLTDCNDNTNVIESNSQNLLNYIGENSIIKINGYDECWQVDFKSTCDCIVLTWATEASGVNIVDTGNKIATYNSRNVYEIDLGFITVYIWWDSDAELWILSEDGYGPDAGDIQSTSTLNEDCPVSVSDDWQLIGQIAVISINKCLAACGECPIPVSVIQSYTTCAECLPIIAYKFTNCNNTAIVKYSTDDYSAYVGKSVQLECGDCWSVELINYTPPSTQPINIEFTFDNCTACNRTYYKLTDCLNPGNTIYTYADIEIPPVQDCDCIKVTYQLKPTCDTIKVTYQLIGEEPVTIETTVYEVYNGKNSFSFEVNGETNLIYWRDDYVGDITWILENVDASGELTQGLLELDVQCPFGSFTITDGSLFESFVVEPVTIPAPITVEVESSGIINGKKAYNLNFTEDSGAIVWNNDPPNNRWQYSDGTNFAYLESDTPCPFGTYTIEEGSIFELFVVEPCLLLVVKIKGCDTCFTVEETREPINAGIVTITDSFIDCPECLLSFPCICNTITNTSDQVQTYCYIDCDVETQSIELQPGETSDKLCVIKWIECPESLLSLDTAFIETFGDCVNNQCPVEPLPKRKVKPGYSTPTCDIEKYEKITCKASEFYYKQVMRLRYGISNCCPEDEEKWLIKKELIDLDALRDPDYICTPVTTCCGQTIETCGCGCNQTLKTCNS
jgi:hypothetical protein